MEADIYIYIYIVMEHGTWCNMVYLPEGKLREEQVG